jgi:Rad3-related DNA helicase
VSSILDFVPKTYQLREVQRKALLDIEQAWPSYDVIVVPGPVAFGKSLVGTTLALWQQSRGQTTAYLTSQVILQEQLARTPPYFPVLKGRSRYTCSNSQGEYSCEERQTAVKRYCGNCPYVKARQAALTSDIGVFNFHSFLFNKGHKDVLFVDEAHTLMGMISEFYTLKVWKHKTFYPEFHSKGDVAIWIEQLLKQKRGELSRLLGSGDPSHRQKIWDAQKLIDKLSVVYQAIDLSPADFFVEQTIEPFRGKNLEVLKIRPINIKNIRTGLWPHDKVHKIVMSSATIRDIDIDDLGLNSKKVIYLDCASPIPVENRPFIFIPVANMGFKYQKKNAAKMAQFLMGLASKHSRTKGVIHMPYGMRGLFKPLLKGKRWMWHDKDDKEEKLKQFMKSAQNSILVAHGMDQGVDLAGPEFGWQAIVKVQWPSLGDAMIKAQSKERPLWYVWQTVRTIVQQYGRICRTPEDKGVTYMLDTAFRQIDPGTGKHRHLWPQWFQDARMGDK